MQRRIKKAEPILDFILASGLTMLGALILLERVIS